MLLPQLSRNHHGSTHYMLLCTLTGAGAADDPGAEAPRKVNHNSAHTHAHYCQPLQVLQTILGLELPAAPVV